MAYVMLFIYKETPVLGLPFRALNMPKSVTFLLGANNQLVNLNSKNEQPEFLCGIALKYDRFRTGLEQRKRSAIPNCGADLFFDD